jgi:putative spermidine/putrescine transport system substrate-binding protein
MRHDLFFAIVLALAMQSSRAEEITFTSWGGSYAKAQSDTTAKPFEATTGTKVRMEEYPGGLDQLRLQVKSGNVTWDVVDLTLSDALRACDDGLLERIKPDQLAPGLKGETARLDYVPDGLTDCLAGTTIWSNVLVYQQDRSRTVQPKTVADFFDLVKFPGKRALNKSAQGNLEWALIADGVSIDQVYSVLSTPAGQERAFRKLDLIKSSIIWWETGSEPAQLLLDGKVTMASAYNGRIYASIMKDRKPLAFIWDGQLLNIEGLAIVKGTKHAAAAHEFVRFATQPKVLAAMAPLTAYGPTRLSSSTLIDEMMQNMLPTARWYQRRSLTVDARWWANRADELNKRFAVWAGKP